MGRGDEVGIFSRVLLSFKTNLGIFFVGMNRSFRAWQIGSFRTSMMKKKDEELTLFLDMRKCEKKEKRRG